MIKLYNIKYKLIEKQKKKFISDAIIKKLYSYECKYFILDKIEN